MEYCMDCGTRLESRFLEGEGQIPYCPNCQKFVFPVFNCAVSMVTVDPKARKILLIQQYNRPFWILVAGYVTRGEAAEDTVAREIMEETGLQVQSVRFNRSRFFEPSNTLMLNFTAVVSSEDPVRITDEVDRFAWFSYEEAREVIKPGSLAREFLLAWLDDPQAGTR